MDKSVRIPVRVQRPNAPAHNEPEEEMAGLGVQPEVAAPAAAVEEQPPVRKRREEQETDWRDLALRLQAEMENYRKRQQRLAQDQIEGERQRLLSSFLPVVDDLERALAAPGAGQELRDGVRMTHRAALQMLAHEGTERIEALNRPFDPEWHEAVATVARQQVNAAPNTVVQVLSPGYRRGDQLLRPARVVVAV